MFFRYRYNDIEAGESFARPKFGDKPILDSHKGQVKIHCSTLSGEKFSALTRHGILHIGFISEKVNLLLSPFPSSLSLLTHINV